jgi:hypothetical protein
MIAHAWVEYGGVIVGDDARHVSRFARLASIRIKL